MRGFFPGCRNATGNRVPLLLAAIAMVVTSFGSFAKADLHITGVDNGETTTIRFAGSLILPASPFAPTTIDVSGLGSIGFGEQMGLQPPNNVFNRCA